ncbi:hypothetical protein O6H91_16G039200 [Diphasiastrum complanatum]|uniref:Uncharacterized protein n=1 Tax=Diphasiastrum complanatum TaxID=34168 RepID=A0ACC2BBL5_DIPCM|nr:hypothetical protein O6H91_16G039200 [Diphasiastrum complanatum]
MVQWRTALHFCLIGSILVMRLEVTHGHMECKDLQVKECAFAVSSNGERCVLEKYKTRHGTPLYKCQTSIMMAENHMEWIETDECIQSCGVQRMSVGMSTDNLVDYDFADMLCSKSCQTNCLNIVDLYTKLAAGEGVYLPHLCDSLTPRLRKLIVGQGGVDNSISVAPTSSAAFESRNVRELAPVPSP